MMNCLVCRGAPLEERAPHDGLAIDLCAACGGAWLDSGELGRFGEHSEGFPSLLDRAMKTLLATPHVCPKCSGAMERGWIAEVEAEFKICLLCQGIWIDGGPLRRLRAFIKRSTPVVTVVLPEEPRPRPAANPWSSRRTRIASVCAAVIVGGMLLRGGSKPAKPLVAPASASGQSVGEYEREALAARERGAAAERRGAFDEAEESYVSVGELYSAAIRAAGTPQETRRLERAYAGAGEAIARLASRRKDFAEAEEVQMVRLAIYEHHRDLAGQAKVWRELAAMLLEASRPAEAAKRFERASALYRQAGKHRAAEECRRGAAAAAMMTQS